MRAHGGGRPPVTVSIEDHGDTDTFGQPLLRLVVGEEYICLSVELAVRLSLKLQHAAHELANRPRRVSKPRTLG